MNPVPLFLIIVSLPLLLGGCGEKSVNEEELEEREGIYYLVGSDTPYTGKSFALWENGQQKSKINYKKGKEDGLFVMWHENGQKMVEGKMKNGKWEELVNEWHKNGQKKSEQNYKDGKPVDGSLKYWNSKGEPVDSRKEAESE